MWKEVLQVFLLLFSLHGCKCARVEKTVLFGTSPDMRTALQTEQSRGDLVFRRSARSSVILIWFWICDSKWWGAAGMNAGSNARQSDSCAMIYSPSLTLAKINHLLVYIIHHQMKTLTYPLLKESLVPSSTWLLLRNTDYIVVPLG